MAQCTTRESAVDMEEIIPDYRGIIDDPLSIEEVIHTMLKTTINSIPEMTKFLTAQQRITHCVLNPAKVLFIYKTMIRDGKIERAKHYEQFLKSRTVRANSGVMVVTVVMSPWPSTAEAGYAASDSASVDDLDPLVKSKTAETLSKQHKTFSCKYDCFYCPAEPGQPRSYLQREPAVQRANQHRFDAIAQFRDRGLCYITNGHVFDKIELIVLGGTWSSYPRDYQDSFIRDLYYAANTFYSYDSASLREPGSVSEEIELNESSQCRIIGLTLETRPDQVNMEEIIRFRELGVTRVQLGIQHVDDDILSYINRGCTTTDAIEAIRLLKQNCFKVDIHIMPDLPGSDVETDRQMFEYLLSSPDLQFDQCKIYPCAVVPWTRIETWYKNAQENYDHELNPKGYNKFDNRSYKPYAEEPDPLGRTLLISSERKGKIIPSNPLFELLMTVKGKIHPWIRINRLVRDIPGLYISGGNDREDLRHILGNEMRKRNMPPCKCIRCREVKSKTADLEAAIIVVRKYAASHGTEYFISFESPDLSTIYGFLRLRINDCNDDNQVDDDDSNLIFDELRNTALIRELHVYGTVVPVSKGSGVEATEKTQHSGFGKRLIKKAEEISVSLGYSRIAVISGVGVRNYYRKLGYLDHPGKGHFQIKTIENILEEENEFIKDKWTSIMIDFIIIFIMCWCICLVYFNST
eukprot:Pompholyxophrys_sp_v1_NODE_5_length_12280_cov_3.373988.p1 type:complete len:692 gc:universal NODE_5_length_12280_cov_3.373988:10149-8074(-)